MTVFAQNSISEDFEKSYIDLRQKEGRIYSDEELLNLPNISKDHKYYKEWLMRKYSSRRLINYLGRKQSALPAGNGLRILEIGCGNGWLSRRMAAIDGSKVLGADINFTEIQQAGRVFYDVPNLHFIYTDSEDSFKDKQFDDVVFAASIQYFPSLKDTVRKMLRILKPGGTIHILDSPFYQPAELDAAQARSIAYYRSMGSPEMAKRYFHHSLDEISEFQYSILYDPFKFSNRLSASRSIFFWLGIQHDLK